jgi:hypothetical protein
LKPAHEPVVVARKPLRERTVAAQVLASGTGGLNIDATRIAHASDADLATSLGKNPGRGDMVTSDVYGAGRPQQSVNTNGRWPANVALGHTPDCRQTGTRRVKAAGWRNNDTAPSVDGVYGDDARDRTGPHYADHDGLETVAAWECSPECPVRMLDEQDGERPTQATRTNPDAPSNGSGMFGVARVQKNGPEYLGEQGGPSRFFYTAKASTSERDGATHPTVKPLDLMRWLVRLVTPPGGVVLEPFAGSGTTLLAAKAEGFRCIGIERDPGYAAMAAERYRRRWVPGEATWEAAEDDDQLSLLGGAE